MVQLFVKWCCKVRLERHNFQEGKMLPLIWFLLAIAVGVLASKRGRSGFGWFVIALLLSPLIGFVFVLIAKDLSTSAGAVNAAPTGSTHVRCPACAEWVLPEASVCKHCGGALAPDADFYVVRAKIAEASKKEDNSNLAIGVGAIVAVIVLANVVSKCTG
ncbi:hypothetical protein KIH07_16905 [Hydrogenophaga taeniospiralis]|uniref:hypothetical protein n=1 Tax=Hydrogenophaga taeniospiralis TaxID=65656 RepID=UPI001CFB690F|nr:hypothetical protein [Hydrogenophaga taeniospiralis]MCB4365425.1 hypothetical protein [Hydrogenophaga taeniospiralis]